jgi:AraC-like DNA-binding protein
MSVFLRRPSLASHARVDWAVLALDAGFYDQAHLAGEVKELTGRTPTEWLGAF